MWTHRLGKFIVPIMLASTVAACTAISGRETAGQYVDDTAISTKIKAAFVRDPVVKASQINVETMQGAVQLSGFVDSADQIDRATLLAKNVEGVRSVKNDLIVRAGNRS